MSYFLREKHGTSLEDIRGLVNIIKKDRIHYVAGGIIKHKDCCMNALIYGYNVFACKALTCIYNEAFEDELNEMYNMYNVYFSGTKYCVYNCNYMRRLK